MPVLRIPDVLPSLIDARLASLVHDSALADPRTRFRHERFLVSRLATGAVMMAALPPYLLWRGVPSGIEAMAVASLLLPLLGAALLSRTGILWLAHAVASAGLTGLVVCLAGMTGGAASAAAVWLVAIPFEAAFSGSRRATVAAAIIAAIGALVVACAGPWLGSQRIVDVSAAVAMPAFVITAIGHVAAQILEHLRTEKRWQARMRDNEARDRLLLSAIDDLVTWHDANGRVLEAASSAARFVGVQADRLRGHGLLERIHVADRPAFLQAISNVAANGQPATLQFRLHLDPGAERADGARLIHAEMRAHRIERGQFGSGPVSVVAVTRDVSEHRRYAEALERARTEAERADEIKSRFLANVTHELRTPLNAIIGFSEVLGGEGAVTLGPERAREYAGIIGASGRHLLDVVNSLLDMSRIQSGNFDYAPEVIDADALVRTCCDLMKLRADSAGISLVQMPAQGGTEITADARACRQILINLLSNAVKFTPRGGRVEIRLRRTRTGLDITVADTGSGIREAALPRLGTPFFQSGSGDYKRMHEGTGLGLSVVQGLVGLHGGAIAIESAPEAGTSVTVTLPLDCRRPDAPIALAPVTTAVRRAGRPAAAAAVAGAPLLRLPLGLFEAGPVAGHGDGETGLAVPLKRSA
ncbi:PAS domain-containing sensor histidine kinase [Methylobacterium symbioticum]|uniref:histidine kinase n=1 Tax=Methylobacterium symbioticum TaxID=2584084 RepID=A0A509E8X4_9HYPH|nr:PAS domain-containing sensor histidine kinase [Methylobacterium symbioticum]VUD70592.1 Histidine protein kinase DivJ [Methylobacterium symbioticum]